MSEEREDWEKQPYVPNDVRVHRLLVKLLETKDEQISLLNKLLDKAGEELELEVKRNIELTNEIAYLKSVSNHE